MKKILFLLITLIIPGMVAVAPATATTTGLLDGAFSYPGYVGQQFNGSYCAAPNVCEVIPGYTNFPSQQNIEQGVVALGNWLATHPDSVVVGTSEGAQVVYQYGRENPTSTQQFVVTGNPERKYGGVFYSMGSGVPPGGQITDVAVQYDFFADYPNNPASQYYWLAVWNVWAGGFWTHIFGYNTVNLSDPNNVTWQENNITYVLVPNQPSLWVPQAWIEDAYIRPTGPVIYGQSPTTNTATTQEVSSSIPSTPQTQSNSVEFQTLSTTTPVSPTTQTVESSSPVPVVAPKPKRQPKTVSTTSTSVNTSVSTSASSKESPKSSLSIKASTSTSPKSEEGKKQSESKKLDTEKLVKKHG